MSRQPPSAAFHKSKTLEGKFIIGDEIGKGAYGRVYKGLDLENGDFVAIKQVSLQNIAQEDLNIIMQEIDLLKNLNHKNIVKYLGSLKTKTDLHIILEYVENGSLANIIKPTKFGPFPESLVSVYISQVLEGLVYLHEQGVIHRDIKGANILTTKEGLVKLADFGVATKLTEADANTHSVVGTPYWMAPEVIEMSGVCAASDVWSVGCTVIELLTCVPPYFDLQPMPALFRIVQDEQPPIPDGLSPGITDFLCQCFKKDARHRPDAKTLLSHPWIQNSRRALQTSLRHSGTKRSLKKKGLEESEASNGDDPVTAEEGSMELEATNAPEIGRSFENDGATVNPNEEIVDQVYDDASPDVPSLAIRQVQMNSDRISTNDEAAASSSLGAHGSVLSGTQETIMTNDDLESSDTSDATKQFGGKKCSDHVDNELESQDNSPRKVVKKFLASGEYELNKFSDTPGDASLDDLLPLLGRSLTDHSSAGASTSASSLARQESAIDNSGKTDLAMKLRAAIAKKQRENESGQAHSGDILRLMMGVLKEDGMRSKSLSHFQAVEFSKLVSSLRPDEPEDGIVSACQKLTSFFIQRPEQKIVFVNQHGFLPLVELLEVPKTRVVCSALQVLNQIIKDNTDFQVNACLVGLIPITMSFALPDRPYEVRMEAAYFLQQLCQSSLLTLQMFIACRGIPILVGFLEADYAKFRELVHMAIDGMWQIFKLQQSTSRNDFCRIASKNGILLRLINTLYSMSEASRLETLSSGGGFPSDGLAQKPWSGISDPSNPSFLQPDIPLNGVDQPEILRSKQGGVQEPERASPPQFPESLLFPLDSQKERSSNATVETPGSSEAAGVVNHPPTLMEGDSNGVTSAIAGHQETVRPLLSLLEKEPPSRHFSGQLEFARHLSGLEKQESILPRLHSSNEKKTNGNLMNEFAEGGRENAYMDSSSRSFLRRGSKKVGRGISNDGVASTSQIGSQIASGALTGSGVLNARPGSDTSSGLLSHTVLSSNADFAREYLEKVADLLLEFATADSTVKSFMCSQSLLTRLFQMFNKIEPPILLKLLKCINHLSTDPHCLEHLQRADAIKYLIPNLDLKEGPLVSQIHHEVLNAIFNLCKINKRRQEQAAENGIIPHLMHFIMTGSPLKQYALPLLCDMAHASRNSRDQLRAHGGLDVYLSLLEDDLWSVTALDSLAICLAHDNESRKVEQALLKKDAIQKLVKFFQFCPEQNFLHILEPFLKIVTKSTRINTTLAVNGLTPLLIFRLDHQDAIARLNLLKLIKAVYEHHPRPKQLIVENDLPQKLQNLIEERRDGQSSGGQVLVKQMATSLLKALHINTVL